MVDQNVNIVILANYYLALPQGQGHHNSVSQLLWARSTYPTLSTFPVGGNRSTRRKLTTFAERWLYSFHMRTGFKSTLLGIELGTLEVKGEWYLYYIKVHTE